MRLIRELVKFIARVFLNKNEIKYKLPVENYSETDYLHKQLFSMIAEGKINEAENLLFEKLDINNKQYLELALDFYNRLNYLDDEFLEENNFTRLEIEEGLKSIAKEFGIPL